MTVLITGGMGVIGSWCTRELVERGFRVVTFDNAPATPQFNAHEIGVVHQEDERPRIFGEVAERDVLAVAPVVGEAQRLAVQDFEESSWAAAMLDVGLAIRARRAEIERPHVGDEMRQLRRDGLGPASLLLHALILRARPAPLLLGFDTRGKGDVGCGAIHRHSPNVKAQAC